MTEDEVLLSSIKASRKMTEDSSMVIYNMTKGIDFSNPKKVASSLASVFFETDAINWFSVDGDHIQFNPSYRVRILLAEEHNKLLNKVVDDFLADLKEKEITHRFSQQIKDLSANMERMQSAMATHAFYETLNRRFNKRVVDSIEVEDDLLTDLLEAIEIRTPNNVDLIDWENLPI